ncbi:tetratricopeptide repeat protein [Leeuwenhoekiella parthenopeia]|uniref:Tetratricopeptide repeat protein n=1 Tax=Leeuwenhoekiella parthenopeia TaxID=2890320 RepID=A0ABS8GPB8_9FLAO|nr:tetratricopeptide repeat protein [Leeuwenhoekiella parthenopeia]MCC4211836.1 tetratricopeptide repeat protein [Leeuwenhoekiella parthenopeia]
MIKNIEFFRPKSSGFRCNATQLIFAFVVLFVAFVSHAQTPEQLFETGNSQYAQNNYEEAIKNYEKVLDAGYESAAVYYNLANANYKLNRIAPSIYNYEKALQLKPNDQEIKNNLEFAQNMTVDAITPLPQNIFKKWYRAVLGLFSVDGWAVLTVALLGLFTLSFLFYYFIASTSLKRTLFTVSFLALGLGLLSLTLAFQSQSEKRNRIFAVIFSPEAEIKNAPNLAGESSFVLHEGTKVRVLEQDVNWAMIQLADGKEGWIPVSDIKLL